MKPAIFGLLLSLAAVNCLTSQDSALKLMLDQTELMMAGNPEFDPVYYQKLVSYMDD